MNTNTTPKVVAFTKKDQENIIGNKPRFLRYDSPSQTHPDSLHFTALDNDQESLRVTLHYGGNILIEQTTDGGNTWNLYSEAANTNEVRLALRGDDPRQARDQETFEKKVTELFETKAEAMSAKDLVQQVLGADEENSSGIFQKGRKWLTAMVEDGLLETRPGTAIPGQRGRAPLDYAGTSEKAKAFAAVVAKKREEENSRRSGLIDALKSFAGQGSVTSTDNLVVLDFAALEAIVSSLNVNEPATV